MDKTEIVSRVRKLTDRRQRESFVEQACGNDPSLRSEVEALLTAAEGDTDDAQTTQTGSDSKFDEFAATQVYSSERRTGHSRTTISGHYDLLERIGEGGMGEVWSALQTTPVKRRVAVKLMRTDRSSSQALLSRFETERQAIALMDHPNIARLLEAGATDEGAPFFVMELVQGPPITEYCNSRHLSLNDRLRLFQQVCSAVQHAHQKGVIHRDLKPSNILVETHDGQAIPKVIDFGLAKATNDLKLFEHSELTGMGVVLGTPLYMAPEQAVVDAVDVDTRADVYALGVILYELLTGETPIDTDRLKQAAVDQVLRMIREEDPPTPSNRLGSQTIGLQKDSANSVITTQSELLQWTKAVKGDLDWITMKALDKDRQRRYESASSLGMDVGRYLANEPVLAGPPHAGYRLQKFVRRNRGQIAAAGFLLLAILAGLAGTSYGLIRAEKRRADAEQATINERAAKEQEASQRVKAENAYARMADVLDAMTSSVAGDSLTTQKRITPEQKTFLTDALSHYREFAAVPGDDHASRERRANAAIRVGMIEYRLGRLQEGATAFGNACQDYGVLVDGPLRSLEFEEKLAHCHKSLGICQAELGQSPESEAELREAIELYRQLVKHRPADRSHRSELAMTLVQLASILSHVGRLQNAEAQINEAIELQQVLVTEFPREPEHRSDLAISYNNLALILDEAGMGDDARVRCQRTIDLREALMADFPKEPRYRSSLAKARFNLANLLTHAQQTKESEHELRRALGLFEDLSTDYPSAPEHQLNVAKVFSSLGALYLATGDAKQAADNYQRSIAMLENLVGEFPDIPAYRSTLGKCLTHWGNALADRNATEDAQRMYQQGLELFQSLVAEHGATPEYQSDLATSYTALAGLAAEQGKGNESASYYQSALHLQTELVATAPAIPEYRLKLANNFMAFAMLLSTRDLDAAQKQTHPAIEVFTQLLADFPDVPEYREGMAKALSLMGLWLDQQRQVKEAESYYLRAVTIQQRLHVDYPGNVDYAIELGGNLCNVGHLMREGGQPSESLTWYDQSADILRSVSDVSPENVRVQSSLRNTYWGRGATHDFLGNYVQAARDWDSVAEISLPSEQSSFRLRQSKSLARAGQAKEAVAEVRKLLDTPGHEATVLYRLARVLAIASGQDGANSEEYGKQSVDTLGQAIQAGWKDIDTLRQDPDFGDVREREDLRELLETLDGK